MKKLIINTNVNGDFLLPAMTTNDVFHKLDYESQSVATILNNSMPDNYVADFNSPDDLFSFRIRAVDLGLSVKWGNVNVGATDAAQEGLKFNWGHSTPGSCYWWRGYIYAKNVSGSFNLYCTLTKYNSSDRLTTLQPLDDGATVLLGNNWRTPTKKEIDELVNQCRWEFTNKVAKITGPNGNYIYLNVDTWGYWSSSLSTYSNEYGGSGNLAYCMVCSSSDIPRGGDLYRCTDLAIRPVYTK